MDKNTYLILYSSQTPRGVKIDGKVIIQAPTKKSDEYYAAKRIEERKKIKARNIKRGHNIILKHLKGKSCMDCGYSNIIALEFDHRDPSTKCAAVVKLVNDCVSPVRIEAEIAKCDVVCAN